MTSSQLKKFLCYALVIATLFNGFIAPAAKAFTSDPSPEPGLNESISNAAKANEQAEYKHTDNENFTELSDKRTEYVKYYQLESKRYEAVSFGLPVHYFEDGEFKQIDNTLELSATKDGFGKYVNKANNFRVELAAALTKDWTASIRKDQYKISWSIIGVSKDLLAASMSSLEQSLPTLQPLVPSTPEPTLTPAPVATEAPSPEPTPAPTPEEPMSPESVFAELSSQASIPPEPTLEPEATPAEETISTPVPETTPSPEPVPTPSPELTPEPTPEPTLAPNLDELKQFGTALAPSSALVSEALTRDAWSQLTLGEQRRNLPGISSDVVYKDVLPGVDLQYVVISDRIKENMILNQPTKVAQITQKLQAEGLNLIEEEDGTITAIAKDTQQPVFKMQAPFMMDKEGNGCNISFDLIESNGFYYLIYNLDQEWLATAKYPVTIDPTITTSLNPADIYDARICSGLPSTNYSTSYLMCTGNGSSSGINYSLVKFNNMPVLGPSEMIVYAGYRVKRASSSAINSTVTVHEITSSWTPGSVTWSNKPSFNSSIEDYSVVDTVAGKTWEWDITRIAKNWYTGSANNGILLKDISDSGGYKEWYTANATYGDVPYAYFVYTDYAGLEGYWDYASSSVGRGGEANVNLYNGNMVYTHSDLAMSGSRMPVAVDHVFNSTSRNTNEGKMLYGKGWRTNYDQRIAYISISGISYYKYTDEDGTVHYFVQSGGEWKSEDGIDLKLTVGTGNVITIKDKIENKMVFYPVADSNKPGFLNYIEDSNGNRQTIGYDSSHRINKITDGAGRVILLERNGSGYLQAIKQPVDATNYRSIQFAYDTNNRLSSITYPDSKTTTFAYDSNGNLISATNFDGKKTSITYQPAAPYRVTKVEESNGSVLGGLMNLAYGYNRTEITDVEGRKAQYQFNDFGNTVCVIGPDGSASYSKFGATANGASTNNINKIILSSKQQKFGVNYLLNHNMEASSDWTMNSLFGSTGTHDYASDQKYYGAKSLKLTKTNTAGYERASQSMTLEKGKTYTLSGYIKTSDVTGSASGAYLGVLYNTASGQPYVTSQVLKGTNDWDRYSVTFTIPSDASSHYVSVYLDLMGSTGTVWFDCLQLEEGSVVNRYNLVENADFSTYTGNAPKFWMRNNLSASDTVVTTADNGRPSYMSDARFTINGDCVPNNWKSIDQTIPVTGSAGDSYVVGGWAKGTSVSLSKDPDYRVFGLSVQFKYTDGTSEYAVISFNEDSYIWQYVCGGVVAKKDYNSIVIRPHYSANANAAWFDGIQLFREAFGETFSYDKDGNLVTAEDLESKNEQFTYTNNDLTKYKTPDLREYTYTYDAKHNLKTAVSPTGLTYAYDYDAYGNQTASKLGNESEYIRSTTTYTTDGNYVDKITDPFGKTVDYDFNAYKGTLSQFVDPNGNALQYTYDQLDRLKNVTLTGDGKTMSNGYEYTGDLLNGISHSAPAGGNVSYTFTYNDLGWRTEAKVGSQSLATYTLKARTGLLEDISYGNGHKIDYSYDALDRVNKISQGSADLYTYEYDNAGNVGYHNDLVNNQQYWYEYDSLLRLGKITSKDASGIINWTKYGFDNKNNLTSFKEKIGSAEYTSTYTYDDEDRSKGSTFGMNSTEINYDSILGRITDYDRKVNGSTVYNTSFMYAPGDGVTSADSVRVSAITNGTETLSYAYDNRGFITSVSSIDGVSQYRYDAFGQLIRENYNWNGLGFTMIYTYDEGGNITSKSKYPYVAGDGNVGAPVETINYGYGDSNWKDKLTSYNGNTITYDEIGNPLSDGKWTYTWTQGRTLQEITDGATTVTYKYNDQGLRTEKTVNGISTKYNVAAGMITWEKTGTGTSIYYLYDANGTLWGLNYNGNVYFYVRNVQNDIIGVVDNSGTTVVEYNYDAWGKILSVSGSLASTLGQDNPFRYKGYYYDKETNLYYLESRYYDPETSRYLNADGYAQTGQGLTGLNMYAYCGNNPVNRADPDGMFWKEIGNFFKKVGNAIATAAKAVGKAVASVFGAGSSTTSTIYKSEKSIISDPSPITVKTGTKTTKTISQRGNSSKPISVYASRDVEHPIKSSSAGLKINISSFTLKLNLSLDNIGLSGSVKKGDISRSFGVSANLSELKIGFDVAKTTTTGVDLYQTSYGNASFSAWALAFAYILVTTGQSTPAPQY